MTTMTTMTRRVVTRHVLLLVRLVVRLVVRLAVRLAAGWGSSGARGITVRCHPPTSTSTTTTTSSEGGGGGGGVYCGGGVFGGVLRRDFGGLLALHVASQQLVHAGRL